MFKPASNFLTDSFKAVLCGSFLLFVFSVCLCHTVLSVHCSLVVTCWERADILALFYVMFSCVLVTFQYGVQGQVMCLIVLIPDRLPSSFLCKTGVIDYIPSLSRTLATVGILTQIHNNQNHATQ